MDWVTQRKNLSAAFSKYKYVLLIVALGIFFMILPGGEDSEQVITAPPVAEAEASITEQLCEILAQIDGVGKVRVLITEQTGAQTIYQVDEDRTENADSRSVRTETVILSRGGEDSGLIQTVTPPTYLGAIIVCQGADSPTVRLAVANAVSAVTGISTDRISVLKMK